MKLLLIILFALAPICVSAQTEAVRNSAGTVYGYLSSFTVDASAAPSGTNYYIHASYSGVTSSFTRWQTQTGSPYVIVGGTSKPAYQIVASGNFTTAGVLAGESKTIPFFDPHTSIRFHVTTTSSMSSLSQSIYSTSEIAVPTHLNVLYQQAGDNVNHDLGAVSIQITGSNTATGSYTPLQPSEPTTVTLQLDKKGLLVHWPVKEENDLGNGVKIPAWDGKGSPWVYIPMGFESSEDDSWFSTNFPKGQKAPDGQGNDFYVAYFAADGETYTERDVDAGVTFRQNPNTGDLYASLGVDGFAHSVVLPEGFNNVLPQLTTTAEASTQASADDPYTRLINNGQIIPTQGGSIAGASPFDPSDGISIGGITPTPSSIPLPNGVSALNSDGSVKARSTINNYFQSLIDKTESDGFSEAAGFSYGEDDGSGLTREMAEALSNQVTDTSSAASGWLSFLTIDTIDPGIDQITFDFDIPKTQLSFDWEMPDSISQVLRKLILYILYSAFWGGVARKLMV